MIKVMNDFYGQVDIGKLGEQQKTKILEFYRDGVRGITRVLANEKSDFIKLLEIDRYASEIYIDVLHSFREKEYCNEHKEVVEEKGDYLLTQDSIETLKKASLDILNGLNVDQEAITNIWQSITAEQERLSDLEAEQQ